MDEGDAFGLTCCEEANDIQVDQTDFVQVERDARPAGLFALSILQYAPAACGQSAVSSSSVHSNLSQSLRSRSFSLKCQLERLHAECHLEFPSVTGVFGLLGAALSAFAENSACSVGVWIVMDSSQAEAF